MWTRTRTLITVGVMLVLGPTMTSCNSRSTSGPLSNSNMASENEQRVNLGLRVIAPTWCLYRAEFGEEDWKTTSSGASIDKKVHRDKSGKLLWQEDYYFSGKTFVTAKGQDWEMLVVHYDYGSGSFTVNYIGQDPAVAGIVAKLIPTSSASEKLLAADNILKKWGKSRL